MDGCGGNDGTRHPGFVGQSFLYTFQNLLCLAKKTVLDPQEGDLHGMSYSEWH